MSEIIPVFTEGAPRPLGHYNQAVRGGGFIHISGQLPISSSGVPDNQAAPFEAQARLVIVRVAGADLKDVLKVTAYVVGAENWPVFNDAFIAEFGDHKPSRSVVPVPELHHGYLIEIDGLALDTAGAKSSDGSNA